jgi:hypothetical protein
VGEEAKLHGFQYETKWSVLGGRRVRGEEQVPLKFVMLPNVYICLGWNVF